MEKFKKSLIVVCLLFLSGCASVMHGSTQDVGISSTPDGAHFAVSLADGGSSITEGTTPRVVTLKRKHAYVVNFEKEGYESGSATLSNQLSGAVAGNILAGGLIGWAVDAHKGADRKLVPENIHVELKPQQATIPAHTSPPKEIKSNDQQQVRPPPSS
ncbi:MAG: hypothetical protein A3E19_03775 [Planctomycetes bacterium RIFCSPHIGHO2_12_FULL_52_36]|nr:MAG: hypothetical protein A3D89_05135 [Planctomycetes bacterium RIFCSPHIGHO2_02_FULL_52_58]OHB93958.1 MAG: hypothetical protein A3E19_03775 [Planctomycetes bacterium RIFCSPHIGHO2_12_FULL_52_36]